MAVNGQYAGDDPFGGPGGYAFSGAPGTPGEPISPSRGDLATVEVTPPDGRFYGSVTAKVDHEDTSGTSSDVQARMWTSGTDEVSASWSAGVSHIGASNPNAMSVPSMADQVRAAR